MTYLSQKGIGRRLPTLTKRGRQRLRLAEDRVDDTQKRSSLCKTQEHADAASPLTALQPVPKTAPGWLAAPKHEKQIPPSLLKELDKVSRLLLDEDENEFDWLTNASTSQRSGLLKGLLIYT